MADKNAPWDKSKGKTQPPATPRTEWRLPNPDLVPPPVAPLGSTVFVGGSQRPEEDESEILMLDTKGPCLAVTAGPGKGKQWQLGERALIGREQPADVVVEDTAASRRHAQVYKKNGRWFLKDLGSTNGTYLDGPLRGAERMLWDGDVFRIGDCELTFSDASSKKKK